MSQGIRRANCNNTIVINYNDILTGNFFKNFRALLGEQVSTLPVLQSFPKRKVPFLFQGGVSPPSMVEELDKIEWEDITSFGIEIDSANKENRQPAGEYSTSTWITTKNTWDLIKGKKEKIRVFI